MQILFMCGSTWGCGYPYRRYKACYAIPVSFTHIIIMFAYNIIDIVAGVLGKVKVVGTVINGPGKPPSCQNSHGGEGGVGF